MTTTYDPGDPVYLDESDVRREVMRVFDVCGACRACVGLCSVFPAMFDILDRLPTMDAGLFTPAQQDQVADRCVHCDQCVARCPYAPGLHEPALDFPRLMERQLSMRIATGQVSLRRRIAMRISSRPANALKIRGFGRGRRIGRL